MPHPNAQGRCRDADTGCDVKVRFIAGETEKGMDRGRPLFMAMGALAMQCGEAGTKTTIIRNSFLS